MIFKDDQKYDLSNFMILAMSSCIKGFSINVLELNGC